MSRLSLSLVVVAFTFLAVAGNAQGAPVYDTSAAGELTGSRSAAAGELIPTDSVWDTAVIAWEVLVLPGNLFQYTYTLTGFGEDQGGGESNAAISHLTLDISNDVPDGFGGTTDPTAIMNAMFGPDLLSLLPIDPLNILFGDFDGIIGAVKFDVGTEMTSNVYQFLSSRQPVYGDVFVKNGNVDLHNAGLLDPLSEDIGDFVVRPDGQIPEPSTFVLAFLSFVMLIGYLARSPRAA